MVSRPSPQIIGQFGAEIRTCEAIAVHYRLRLVNFSIGANLPVSPLFLFSSLSFLFPFRTDLTDFYDHVRT